MYAQILKKKTVTSILPSFFFKIVQYAFHSISVIVILSEIEMDILIQVS